MLLFLLPLLFNPFGLIIKWLPAMYLGAWPIIIQTLGRETLITHALVLIMFILTCDISRQMMLNTIGFDVMSYPIGIGLLWALTTDHGAGFLSMIRPLFSGLLVVADPLFLLIEIYLFIDMIKSFNRWISTKANERDENSEDLSNWEPPLSRGAILARIAIIIITISSYIGVYMIIQESKTLLGIESQVPVNFNYTITALVTLQIIAFSSTIYKDEGVLSETALVALLAAVPIFIASWSYYHLIVTANTTANTTSSHTAHNTQDTGLSLDKLAKYYFGPDFWYILAGRFVCLSWWAMVSMRRNDSSGDDNQWSRGLVGGQNDADPSSESLLQQIRTIWLNLTSWLPISKRSLVKILIVLAYAQMLIQQMDNKEHLHEQVHQLAGQQLTKAPACCGGSATSGLWSPSGDSIAATTTDLSAWFSCMWSSAKACTGGSKQLGNPEAGSRAARYYRLLADSLMNLTQYLYKLWASFDPATIYHLWIARWRSNIVQRLCQSMLVQVYYITHVLFVYE